MPKPSRPKFGNTKIIVDGFTFDSKKEANRYFELCLLQKAGKISNLRRQMKFELAPKVHLLGEPRAKPALRYIADFVYEENGVDVIEDVKSPVTRKLPEFRTKMHLMKATIGLDVRCI